MLEVSHQRDILAQELRMGAMVLRHLAAVTLMLYGLVLRRGVCWLPFLLSTGSVRG